MRPLWQAVSLINTHKGYGRKRGPVVQQRHPTSCHSFRGHQQEVNFTLFDILEHTFPLSCGHVGMKACSLYTRWQASHLCRKNKIQNAAWNIPCMHIPGISIHNLWFLVLDYKSFFEKLIYSLWQNSGTWSSISETRGDITKVIAFDLWAYR